MPKFTYDSVITFLADAATEVPFEGNIDRSEVATLKEATKDLLSALEKWEATLVATTINE